MNALLNKLFGETGDTYLFHMTGGHIIEAKNVKELIMTSNRDGSFAGYEVRWAKGCCPKMWSLNTQAIVAVTIK
jgi:hypothetical protein